MTATAGQIEAQAIVPRDWRRYGLYLLLGFAAGLPFYMFNAVLLYRLAKHNIDIGTVGFFAWVALLPTLKFAADAWRIEIAPTQEEQGPLVAANLWGYRSAMVAAGSGAIWVATKSDWTSAYLVIAALAFLPFPLLAAMRLDPKHDGGRGDHQ